MPYLLFLKKRKILNCHLLQIIGGALWVKCSLPVFAPVTITVLPESWAVLVHIPVVHFKYILKVNKDRNITLGIPRAIVKRISMGCICRPEIII